MSDITGITNAIYMGTVGECERREFTHEIMTNGHHMAQAITQRVSVILKVRRNMKLDDVLIAVRAAVLSECALIKATDTETMADKIVQTTKKELLERKLF